MAENLPGALISAQNFCWDETIGYHMGGNMNPDTDCSGFVWQALHDNGFNVGSYRFDTTTMRSYMLSAGFTEFVYDPNQGFNFQHGDICMYDEGGGRYGHTFFYAENVTGYVNGYLGWRNCDGTIGNCSTARIEASGTHEHPEAGDQNNGLGAHTEVWVHTYSGSVPVYQVDHGDAQGLHWPIWYIFRWGAPPPPPPPTFRRSKLPIWLIDKITRKE